MTTDNFRFYLQNRLIETGQTGGQLYSDTSPFSVPCAGYRYQTPSFVPHKFLRLIILERESSSLLLFFQTFAVSGTNTLAYFAKPVLRKRQIKLQYSLLTSPFSLMK
jgi:hypothetical protein